MARATKLKRRGTARRRAASSCNAFAIATFSSCANFILRNKNSFCQRTELLELGYKRLHQVCQGAFVINMNRCLRQYRHTHKLCRKRQFNSAPMLIFLLLQLTSLIHSSGTRGHAYKLFPHYNHLDLHKYFFSGRIIEIWNSLPAKSDHFSNIARFTRFIRSTDLSRFLSLGY